MLDINTIDVVLKALRSLPVVSAYTGTLFDIKQKSYVEVGDITTLIGDLEDERKKILKEENILFPASDLQNH